MVTLKHTFPESFFEEEDRLGFHIDRKRKEIWAVELDLLYELDRVCRKLEIPYYLDGGTLLGAARDGRFIPWDDDIDVAILREDYDRFLKEAGKEFEPPVFLQTGYSEKDYLHGHCQLRRSDTCAILPAEQGKVSFNQGIFLDIFVLDDLFPEKLELQYQYARKLRQQRQKWNHHDYHPNPVRWAVRWSRYLLYKARYRNSASFYKELEAIFRSREKSEYLDYLMLNNGPEEVHMLKRTWYEETVQLPFEGKTFPAPKGYREYLDCYYGDDWLIPQNTASMHNLKGQVIFDTERSYLEVMQERSLGEKEKA